MVVAFGIALYYIVLNGSGKNWKFGKWGKSILGQKFEKVENEENLNFVIYILFHNVKFWNDFVFLIFSVSELVLQEKTILWFLHKFGMKNWYKLTKKVIFESLQIGG